MNLRSTAAQCLLAIVLVAPAAAAQERLPIPSRTPGSWSEYAHGGGSSVTVTGDLYLPSAASGRVPALILKHGSAGLGGPQGENVRRWARSLNEWGIAAFVVDSFGPRGIGDSAADQGKLRSLADLADAFAALKVLAADPRIDPARIGIMGWSRGGGVAMVTALESARAAVLTAKDPHFAAHVVFYGAASPQYRDSTVDGAPMLFLHGESDDLAPIGATREFADWLRTKGTPVTFQAYAGAYHDFDVDGGVDGTVRLVESARNCDVVVDCASGEVVRMGHRDVSGVSGLALLRYMRGCMERGATLHPDAGARADAVEKVRAFLSAALRPPG